MSSRCKGTHERLAFTLVELLACAGIISLLVGLLMPAISSTREAARLVVCASNERQICQALFIYAASNRGNLPMNVTLPKAYYWYDFDRVGKTLTPSQAGVVGGVGSCPSDQGGLRSYAMNVWAGYTADSTTISNGFGTLWRLTVPQSQRYILVAEKWSSAGSAALGWTSTATLATTKDTPGRRFGGGVGITPLLTSGHFGQANCELPFQRHRSRNTPGLGNQPTGRVNIGYADGHVALKANTELVDPRTGLSTLDSWWSPLDDALNK